jgi:hypothetical protein
MMKNKITVAALALAATMFCAANAFATASIIMNGAGSSAAFNAIALAAYQSSQCGTNIWTKKSTAQGIDSRSSSIPAETANIWVIWNTDSSGNVTTICSYLRTDSIVGVRLFLAQPTATLSIPSSNIGVAGDNLVPTLTDVPLSQNAYNAINGQPFNCAPTDIRPEDAKFGTTRALTALDTSKYTGLGYGPGPVGTAILSEFSTSQANVVDFAISGTDPITGQAAKNWVTTNVGGQAIIVFVNTNDTSSAGLGNAAFNNINRFVLTRVWNGTATRTRDIIPSTGLTSVGLHVLNREPLSGTFNTFEFQGPRLVETNSSQEVGVNPAVSGGNPMNLTYASGGTRQRTVGTGEMVSEVSSITDSIGYAFWSTGNFAKVVGNTKYLTVDGVDPLFASYSGGAFPTCTAPCPGIVDFTNIINGSYPIWNIMRFTTVKPAPSGITGLINAAQTFFTSTVPDMVPIGSMNVFRSHYTQSGITGQNGHKSGTLEKGGDVQGAVLTVQADKDAITDTGKEITGVKQ